MLMSVPWRGPCPTNPPHYCQAGLITEPTAAAEHTTEPLECRVTKRGRNIAAQRRMNPRTTAAIEHPTTTTSGASPAPALRVCSARENNPLRRYSCPLTHPPSSMANQTRGKSRANGLISTAPQKRMMADLATPHHPCTRAVSASCHARHLPSRNHETTTAIARTRASAGNTGQRA